MKFAIIGAQCSDKTTTLWGVGKALKQMGYTNFTLVQETARECPYPINQITTFEASNWILLHQILNEHKAQSKWKHVICDRSIIDQIIYFDYIRRLHAKQLNKPLEEFFKEMRQTEYLIEVVNAWGSLHPYDYFFLMRPQPIKADADRPADREYQLEIDRLFMERLAKRSLVTIIDDVEGEDRIRKVLNKIIEMIGDEKE